MVDSLPHKVYKYLILDLLNEVATLQGAYFFVKTGLNTPAPYTLDLVSNALQ